MSDALVYLLVRAHVVPQPESFPAEAALVVLFAGVSDAVPPQFLLLFEALAASLALVGSQGRVVHHVHLQLLPAFGLEAAQIALHVFPLLLLPFLQYIVVVLWIYNYHGAWCWKDITHEGETTCDE